MQQIKNLITTSILFLSIGHCVEREEKELMTVTVSTFIENNDGNHSIAIEYNNVLDEDTIEKIKEWSQNNCDEKTIKTTKDFLEGKEIHKIAYLDEKDIGFLLSLHSK